MTIRTIPCVLLALAAAGCPSPDPADDTGATPLTTAGASTTDPSTTSDSSTTSPTEAGSTSSTSITGDASSTTSDDATGPGAPDCEAPPEVTCEATRRGWCPELDALSLEFGVGGTYLESLRLQCEREDPACGICYYLASTCVQLHGGEACEGLEDLCRCLAGEHGAS